LHPLSLGAMPFVRFLDWAGIGRTKAYDEAKAGRLKLTKVGSKTLVLRSDAQAWLSLYTERKAAA
jgi:hypothetical protein